MVETKQMELIIQAISQLQSQLTSGFDRLDENNRDITKKLDSINCTQAKLESDVNSCFNQVRDIQEDVKEHGKDLQILKPKVTVLESQDRWYHKLLDDCRKTVVQSVAIFLIIFCFKSCDNIKPALVETVKTVSQVQLDTTKGK